MRRLDPRDALELGRLAVALRGKFGGRYWRWRMETALGREEKPAAELRRSALDFGRWRRRMRRMM